MQREAIMIMIMIMRMRMDGISDVGPTVQIVYGVEENCRKSAVGRPKHRWGHMWYEREEDF